MKRIVSVSIATVMLLFLCACSNVPKTLQGGYTVLQNTQVGYYETHHHKLANGETYKSITINDDGTVNYASFKSVYSVVPGNPTPAGSTSESNNYYLTQKDGEYFLVRDESSVGLIPLNDSIIKISFEDEKLLCYEDVNSSDVAESFYKD